MWPTTNLEPGRGGFQNRDVGRTDVHDFGPEYGIDYARYSDPTNNVLDQNLREKILTALNDFIEIEVLVKNGFVILEGSLDSTETRDLVTEKVKYISGVKEVINQIKV